jgi:hypothetical protein
LEQFDRVETYWLSLDAFFLVDVDYFSFFNEAHSPLDRLNNSLIVDFSSLPLAVKRLFSAGNSELEPPVRLRDEFLDFFGLVDAEAKRRRLTRPIGNRYLLYRGPVGLSVSAEASPPSATLALDSARYACSFQHVLECQGLEAGESNADFEVQDLTSVNRNRLVKVGLISEIAESDLDVFGGDGGELGTVDTLKFLRVGNVSLTDLQYLKADVFTLSIAIQPQHHKVQVSRDSSQVVSHRFRAFVGLPHGRSVKKLLRFGLPALVFLGEISVENVPADRGDLELGLMFAPVAGEFSVEDVDGAGSGWPGMFGVLAFAQGFGDAQGN